jgi:hypothetical protein
MWDSLAIVWMIVGLLIAAPYTWLASGEALHFVATIFLGPIGGVTLYFVWRMEKVRVCDKSAARRKFLGTYFFWLIAGYGCLPVLLNGVSVALRTLGFETTAQYIFALRYVSLPAILLAMLLGFLIFLFIRRSNRVVYIPVEEEVDGQEYIRIA